MSSGRLESDSGERLAYVWRNIPDDNCRLKEFAETPMILNVERKKLEPDIAVLEMTGRITMGSDSQKIEWGLAELLSENQRKLIFDFIEVTHLDSSGIGILMMCHAKLKKAGEALRIADIDGKRVNQDLAGFSAAMPGRHRFSRLA